jgi:GTP cyclohydrolase II
MSQSRFPNWCDLPTRMGDFRMYDTEDEGVRLVCFGDIHDQGKRPLLRVHSSCLASEVFGACDCDCADQLRESMKLIATASRGMVIHIHQEGRGQGLTLKIRAVRAMQRDGLDTVEAFESLGLEQDPRTYQPAVEILRSLSIRSVRLITNNPRKSKYLLENGIEVETVHTHPTIRPENIDYLRTKKAKLAHQLPIDIPEEGTGDIRFYHSDQPYGALSNFSAHAVFIDGKIWSTTEHYYQAQKFAGTEREEAIRLCPSPTSAKNQAASWRGASPPDWASLKIDVMYRALRAKFTQHPDLGDLLLRTRERKLVEHTELDRFWGDGGDGSGENMLGVLLMRLRSELRAEMNATSTAV